MIQRQKTRYAPRTWQAEVEKKLRVADASGADTVAHLSPDQALLFLTHFLRREHCKLCREWRDIYLVFVIFILTYWGVFLIWTGHFRMLPIAVGQVVGPLIVAYFGREKRLVGWRNGLRATLFLLKQATLRERVPLLLETTDWLYTRPRLSAPQMREPFAELLTQSLARADTALLESLEPDDIARLVALVVRYPKGKLPDTLLVAAILALTDLQPESIPLRQKLHRLTHHSSPRVREAVEEFYRVPK